MMKRRSRALPTTVIASLVGLAGCMSAGTSSQLKPVSYDQVTYRIPHPWVEKYGRAGHPTKLVTAAMTGDPKTFNWYLEQDFTSAYPIVNAYDTLVESDIRTAAIYPGLAESWVETPDHLHVTFQLREGLKWSDGQPLTADDVQWTYNRVVMNPKLADNTQVDSARINGKFPKVTALDARHVRFDLPEPFAPFYANTAGEYILPRHQWEKHVETYDKSGRSNFYQAFNVAHDFAEEPMVGSGPYLPVLFKPGEYILLNRNPYYAQRVDQTGKPLPYSDQLLFKITPDANAESLRFVAKEADIGMDAQRPVDYQTLKRLEKVGDFHVVNGGMDFATTFFVFNLNRDHNPQHKPYVDPLHASWLQNVHFRRAFSHCVDRKAVIDNVAFGLNHPAYGPESPTSPFFNPHLPSYPYDLDAARKELVLGGFHPGDKDHPCTDAAGHKVEVDEYCYADNPNSVIISNMVKSELEKLGVTMNVKVTTFSTLTTKLESTLDFEIAIMNLSGGPEPNSGTNIWLHDGRLHQFWQRSDKSTDKQPPYDWETQIDNDFKAGAREYDFNKRKLYYWDYQRIVADQVPQIYIYYPTLFFPVSNSVTNATPSVMQEALAYTGYVNIYQLFK